MTNDERNPKPECRERRRGKIALSAFGFRYSFGFRHSSFGFWHVRLQSPISHRLDELSHFPDQDSLDAGAERAVDAVVNQRRLGFVAALFQDAHRGNVTGDFISV